MTPDEQQQTYRQSCFVKRNGKTITDLTTGKAQTFRSVNAAKYEVRTRNLRSYTER